MSDDRVSVVRTMAHEQYWAIGTIRYSESEIGNAGYRVIGATQPKALTIPFNRLVLIVE
jgi:hypothetical protein